MKKNTLWLQSIIIKEVVNLLSYNNHIFKFVGGCVRDSILGREFYDYDIASNFLPEQNIKALKRLNLLVIPTGLNHGTITLMYKDTAFEITSLRKDIKPYGRQAEVKFSKDFFEDSCRRDFTFNALYLNPKNGEIDDYHNGINDLLNKKVNFIGDPQTRISEDFLRILRFFRFNCDYGSNHIESSLLEVLSYYSPNLSLLSKERIYQELSKIIVSSNPHYTMNVILKYNIISNLVDLDHEAIFKFSSLIEIENLLNLEPKLLIRCTFILATANNINQVFYQKKLLKPLTNSIELKNFIIKYSVLEFNEICSFLVHYGFETTITALICVASLNYNNKLHYLEIIKKLLEKNSYILPVNGDDLLKMDITPSRIGEHLKRLKIIFWQEKIKSKEEYLSLVQQWIIEEKASNSNY